VDVRWTPVKAVVDTNVIAYLLLGTEAFVDEARACLEQVATPLAPSHWEAELTNVVWMAVKAGVLSASDGPARLGLARRLGIESVPTSTLSQGALLRAIETGVSVYDTLFVELAARSACPMVTFDKAVLKAFPDLTCRPRDLRGR
jgi:predicted nucleic acid-binding protein